MPNSITWVGMDVHDQYGDHEFRRDAPEARSFLHRAADRLGLSGRALCRISRVARTVADLAGEKTASLPRVAEASSTASPTSPSAGRRAPGTLPGRDAYSLSAISQKIFST